MRHIFLASARDEWQRLRSDRWDRFMFGIAPMLSVLLIWWIFSGGLAQRLPIGVLDEDHSALSRQSVRFLQASPGLSVVQQFSNMQEARRALQAGRVDAVVHLPAQLSQQLRTGRPASVALLHNAQWSLPSGLIQRDVQAVVSTLSAGVEMRARNRRGEPLRQVQDAFVPIRTDMVGLFNVSSNYQTYLATSLMPALLHILAMTAGAWAMGRKLRDRTVYAWLRASIVGRALPPPGSTQALPHWHEVLLAILGKTLWPMLGMMAAASVACTLMTARLHAPFMSWVATWTGLYLLMLLSVAMGALAAALTLSLRMALSATGFITAPAFAFSGVGFPLLAMPPGAQMWAQMLPLTHYLQLQTRMLQMQAPLHMALPTLLALLLASLVLMALAARAVQRACRLPQRWGGR